MMLAVYLISGLVLAGLIFFFPKKKISALLTLLFLVIQTSLTVYAFINKDITELKYFTFDALSLIFMMLTCIISAATFYHSIEYVRDDTPVRRSVFFFSFIALTLS